MATSAQVRTLLESIGPYTKQLRAVIQTEEEQFGIHFEDETWMLVSCDASARHLTLNYMVGQVPPQNKAPIHEAAVLANSLWRQSGGVTVSVDPKGQLMLHKHIFSDLEAPKLVASIEDLREKADAWKAAIVSEAIPTPDGAEAERAIEHWYLKV